MEVIPVTPRVLVMLVAPLTSNVPWISVFPLSVSIVNLLAAAAVWTINLLLSDLTIRSSCIVAVPSTFNVVSRSTACVTLRVSSIVVAPSTLRVP